MSPARPQRASRQRRARGEGGIAQRADGRWIGKVELPPDPVTKKRRQKVVTARTQAEAVRKLNALKRDLADHGDLPTGTETVATWMRYWYEVIDKSKPKTRASYRSSIERYMVPAIGKVRLTALSAQDIRRLERYIVTDLGLSPTTAHNAYRILSRALNVATREGRVLQNAAHLTDAPRKQSTQMRALSLGEVRSVLETVQYDRLGGRWAMALLTGARQGECLGIELDRLDFRTNTVDLSWQLQRVAWSHGCGGTCGRKRGTDCPARHIDAPPDWEHRHVTGGLFLSRPKSRAGWRVIPLVDPLRSILERRAVEAAREPNPHGLLWTADPKLSQGGGAGKPRVLRPLDGKPIDPAVDNRAWHAVLERAGVPTARVHDARHTAITLMFGLDVPETVIMDIAGQSAVAATRGYRARNPLLATNALTRLSAQVALGTA